MKTDHNLKRFIDAQEGVYETALAEIKRGKKTSHWMWFIFPQIQGLGRSETTIFYAIKDKSEAEQYLNDSTLGTRLINICKELMNLETSNPVEVFGHIDSLKLKSSMTLFSLLEPRDPVFQSVLDKFFNGMKDVTTIQLVNV